LSRDGKLEYVHETSWGVSTRLIGALIMTHGDERGLRMPPRIAPIQVVVLPVAQHKEGVLEGAQKVADTLRAAGLRVKFDDRDSVSPGWKFNEWELKGVPLRVEIGPRDLEAGQAMVARRDTFEKLSLPLEGLAEAVKALLNDIQKTLYDQAEAFRQAHIVVAHTYDQLREAVQTGFAKAMWCGEEACEEKIKAELGATTRNMPFDQTPVGDICPICGKPGKVVMYFAKAY
ncbi:MAG TPA: His/Gly/Thr/Pro-type tRNA ligase C-terminal domain-containing protein, partial [Clostridia bacterium]|nr:His/Gly/Thr/Pro-type tRNA ligase C-terminal domain-containing protein [Clostridia bacterium]